METEDHEEETENFHTPPSSPKRQKRRRTHIGLNDKLEDLRSNSLIVDDSDSFYISSCKIKVTESPKENVELMTKTIIETKKLLDAYFTFVSDVYVGKTQDVMCRFMSHKKKKRKPFEALILVIVDEFEHVPSQDIERWDMNLDFVGLLYESMLTKELQKHLVFSNDEPAGGGRMRKKMAKSVIVYALFRVSQFKSF